MGPTRSLVLKILLASAALTTAILLLVDLSAEIDGGCDSSAAGFRVPLVNSTDLDAVFRDLIAKEYLSADDRALCVGPDFGAAAAAAMRRIGFSAAVGASATACCGLPFEDSLFDFAFAVALDRVRVPARVVLEMERVLRPGRVGMVLRLRSGPVRLDGLMKAAAPVASLLRFSDMVGVRAVNGSAMVVFRKRGSPNSANRGSANIKCYDAITKMRLLFSEFIEIVHAVLVIGGGQSGKLAYL